MSENKTSPNVQELSKRMKGIVHLLNHPSLPREALVEIDQRLKDLEKELFNKLNPPS